MIWCVLNDTVLHLSFGHYCNIVSGVFIMYVDIKCRILFWQSQIQKKIIRTVFIFTI